MTFADPRLPVRFWQKVHPEPNTGCWLWGAHVDPAGYGRFRWDGEIAYAHRLVLNQLGQPIPGGRMVDHLCRVRACCNPDHLDVTTPYENRIRGEQGQFGALRGVCSAGHLRSPENVRINHRGYRICRLCDNAQAARAQRARRALAAAS